MIKVNELRIGNYVDNFHGPYDRLQVDAHMLLSADDEGKIQADPIELSPEILEVCGFVNGYYQHKSGDSIQWNNGLVSLGGWDCCTSGSPYRVQHEIKYLHQLQNLYYSLTGSELTVNLTQKV